MKEPNAGGPCDSKGYHESPEKQVLTCIGFSSNKYIASRNSDFYAYISFRITRGIHQIKGTIK